MPKKACVKKKPVSADIKSDISSTTSATEVCYWRYLLWGWYRKVSSHLSSGSSQFSLPPFYSPFQHNTTLLRTQAVEASSSNPLKAFVPFTDSK